MSKSFIHKGSIQDNNWKMFLSNSPDESDLPPDEPYWMITIDSLLSLKESTERINPLGLVLKADLSQDLIESQFNNLSTYKNIAFIAIDFPVYTDGRGFSLAWYLRNEVKWDGELRAMGDVLIDTVNYLSRCGFNSFVLKDGHDAKLALKALELFKTPYQNNYS